MKLFSSRKSGAGNAAKTSPEIKAEIERRAARIGAAR